MDEAFDVLWAAAYRRGQGLTHLARRLVDGELAPEAVLAG